MGDALGDRQLARLLRCLDEELWETRRDPQHNEIGLLYGLISKVRVLIFAREMMAQKWIRPETEYNRFRSQLSRVPADALPEDKKFNPLAMNPYVLFRATGQALNYTQAELVAAMDLLLECNLKLISRSLDPSLVLQQELGADRQPPNRHGGQGESGRRSLTSGGCARIFHWSSFMSQTSNLMVAVFEQVVCIKVCGKADFTSSLDLKKLINELWLRGRNRFVFELCDCVTMDSTFLGMLSGIGLKFCDGKTPHGSPLELFNPNPRIAEVLDNLGVAHLFKITRSTNR